MSEGVLQLSREGAPAPVTSDPGNGIRSRIRCKYACLRGVTEQLCSFNSIFADNFAGFILAVPRRQRGDKVCHLLGNKGLVEIGASKNSLDIGLHWAVCTLQELT
eukprot:gene26757-32333_t